jgi:hypothetical protein
MMHGINKISMLMFLVGILFIIIKKLSVRMPGDALREWFYAYFREASFFPMHIEAFRAHCLGKPGVTGRISFR